MTETQRNFPSVREWLWPILVAATIFLVSGRSNVASPEVPGIDKVAHFFVYGLLATLVARIKVVASWPGIGVYWAMVLAAMYGVTDEFHQSFTPGRSVELLDVVMDTGGAALAVFVYARWRFYRELLERPVLRSQVEISRPAA